MADKLTEDIAARTLPLLQEIGYDLADLEFVKEGADWFLSFYIEHLSPEKAIDVDDCQRASEALSDWLDKADPIEQGYYLEVSSPGIERPLKKEKDFIRFKGQKVCVGTYKPVDGKKTHIGILGIVTGDTLALEVEGQSISIERELISTVRLYWEEDKE